MYKGVYTPFEGATTNKYAKKASKKGYLKKLASQTPIYIRIEEE